MIETLLIMSSIMDLLQVLLLMFILKEVCK